MIISIGGEMLLKPPTYLVKGVLRTPVGISVTVKRRKAYNPSFFSNSTFFHNHFNPRLCSSDGMGEVYVNPHQVSL